MNSQLEFEHCDIKSEEDPLSVFEIKCEPEDIEYEVKNEEEEYGQVDTKFKIVPNEVAASIYSVSEVEETQENVMKLVEDNEKKSQEEQKNTEDEINGLLAIHDSCESFEIGLRKERSKMSVCVQREENVNHFPEFNNFDFCNKDSSDKSNYSTRIYLQTVDKRYTCNFCTKTFTYKYNVIRHIRTHTNEKPFTCDICGKSFSRKCHLNDHNRLHTNEKPFTCNICSKSFCHRSSLSEHTRNHTNKEQFSCNICMKSFSHKSNLAAHIRTHTNEKPFTCVICMKSFSRKTHLASHIRTHTNEKSFTFPLKSFP